MGGPHLSVAMLGQPDSPLRRQIKFKIVGETTPNPLGTATELGYKVDTALRRSFGATGVDGEATIRVDRDEQFRKVTTTSFDLLLTGDAMAMVTFLRPQPPVIVLKETIDTTTFKENRLRYSYTVLAGADGNDLLDWAQTIESQTDENPLAIEEYPGALMADFYIKPRSGHVYTQSGRAVGVGNYVSPPDPMIVGAYLEKPQLTYRRINQTEFETTWHYVMVSPTLIEVHNSILTPFERPPKPQFLNA